MARTGSVLGSIYARHRFVDALIHSWDLAKATGEDPTLDPELVDACLEVLGPQMDAERASSAFGAQIPVSADADAQTRLLGRLGRQA